MPDQLDVAAAGAWVRAFAVAVHENKDYLTKLDSAIGDADHGANMDRGLSAVVAAMDAAPPASPSALFKMVGMTLVSKVGGASGPLYGTFFIRMAAAVTADSVAADAVAKAVRAGLDGIVARGQAQLGDKTLVDALTPACDALDTAVGSGAGLGTALQAAAEAAATGRDATVPMLARKGRASYLGERSIGHQDPGATSMTMLLETAAAALSSAGQG